MSDKFWRKVAWWFAHIKGILTNDRGCRGEGYIVSKNGKAEPCYRLGCH